MVKNYWPDFIIRLTNKTHSILEIKGKMEQRDKTKFGFLEEWVNAVNQHGGFGKWKWAVSTNPSYLERLIKEAFSS